MSYSQHFNFTNRTTRLYIERNIDTEHWGAAHLYSGTLRTVESTPAHLYGRNSPKENRVAIWPILRSLPWPLLLHRHSQEIYFFDHSNSNTPSWISSTSMPSTRSVANAIATSIKHSDENFFFHISISFSIIFNQSCQTCARHISRGHK